MSTRGDAGYVAVELPLAVTLLLLPIAVIVMAIPQWPERQNLARATAREAVSAYANATDPTTGEQRARTLVAESITNWNIDPDDIAVGFDGPWCRGCTVAVRVTVRIPALQVPFLGSVGAMDWSTTARQRIDDYRSLP